MADNADDSQRLKVTLAPLFTTWLYRCESGPRHLNVRLLDLTHRLMQDERNATRRTNAGGWHYASDVFKLQDVVVSEFRAGD